MKQMHRRMMLTSAYQMSSTFDEKAAEADPENKLLWRMSRRRLEAEAMRDAIVAISGDLDTSMGGSIMTFKDRQYVANTRARGGIDYDRSRRAVYLPVVRSSMYEVFQAFDFADPSTANGDRNATVVAPQALFMMNGSVVLRHTRMLADKLLARKDLDDADACGTPTSACWGVCRPRGRSTAFRRLSHRLTTRWQIEWTMQTSGVRSLGKASANR